MSKSADMQTGREPVPQPELGRVFIIRGLPGVGKTTTAALLRDRLEPAVRVSIDTIRYLAKPRNLNAHSIQQAEVASTDLARSYARQGVNAIVEGVILDLDVLETILGSCDADGLPVTVINLAASLPNLLARNDERAPYDRVADTRIQTLHDRFTTSIGHTIVTDDREPEEVVDCIFGLVDDQPVTAASDDWSLFVMRHGAAAVDDLTYPDHDAMPLSAVGHRQVLAARQAIAALGIERVVTSPFRRCIETAELVTAALSVPLKVDDRLKERTFPAFYGVTYDAIAKEIGAEKADYLRYNSNLVSLPDTEDLPAMRTRVLDAVTEILARPERRTLVVSHGGPHGWLCALALGSDDPATARRFALGHARLSAFGRRPGTDDLRLISLNSRADGLVVLPGSV